MNQNNDNSVSNIKFCDRMIIIPKLLKVENNVSNVKHIKNNTCFMIKKTQRKTKKTFITWEQLNVPSSNVQRKIPLKASSTTLHWQTKMMKSCLMI